MQNTLLRPKEACRKLGIGRTELWARTKSGELPQPVKFGSNSIAYVESELDDYILKLMAKRPAREARP